MSYFEEDEIAHLFAQIVLPLHLVHSNNILHRDLKVKISIKLKIYSEYVSDNYLDRLSKFTLMNLFYLNI
jgi:serine/threonine protein kinase